MRTRKAILLSLLAVGWAPGAALAGGAWSDPGQPWCDETSPPEPLSAVVDDTCVLEPEVGTFDPVEVWTWRTNSSYSGYNDVMMQPVVGPLYDTNEDGAIDELDTPSIVVTPAYHSSYTGVGALMVLDGATGEEQLGLTSVSSGGTTYSVMADGGVALGDIDADGSPDICLVYYSGAGVMCLENDGTFKWAYAVTQNRFGGPALADIDNDGTAEVIIDNVVLSHTGALEFSFSSESVFPYAYNMDDDPALEIVSGGYVYDTDGTLIWGKAAGWSAAADVDSDGEAEVVNVYSNTMYLYDNDGTTLWSKDIPSDGGGAPTIADFDNDGEVEFGVAASTYYTVFDTDGSTLWSNATVDTSSRSTGSSVYDFDGDGNAEVVYGDQVTIFVWDGATGDVKYSDTDHASGTLYEYPVIVDLDGDNVSEIVIPSNDYGYAGQWTGITVLHDPSWMPSRPVWNQHTYHITNINDDLSIPQYEENNWENFNNFRAAAPLSGLTSQLLDLRIDADACYDDCATQTVEVYVPIANDGTADAILYELTFSNGAGTVSTEVLDLLASGAGDVLGPFTFTEEQWGDALTVTVSSATTEDCESGDQTVELGAWPFPSLDADGDGHDAEACGGDDCDDADDSVYAGAPELEDTLDNDCDGLANDGLDMDDDGLITEDELDLGTDPEDDDSDDDGLLDGTEDESGTDPLDADSDGDGLSDGTESGLTEPEGEDTDGSVFVPDTDPGTSTDPSEADTDGDGLSDGEEDANGSGSVDAGEVDPTDDDSDDDGLSDGEELGLEGTDPLDEDTDDDGLTDGEEVDLFETDPNVADSDGDGLSDGDEVELFETDPLEVDSDGDTLTDGEEVLIHETDPNDLDSDDDSLDDGTEIDATSTDPLDEDTDDDGLTDGSEVNTHGTDPNVEDTDGDGLGDGEEVGTYGTDPTDADTDDGGVGDGVEVLVDGTDPFDGDDDILDTTDTDGDGLTDKSELGVYGTDRFDPDTDGDGLMDGEEVLTYGTDPLDEDTDDDTLTDGAEVYTHDTEPTLPDTDGDGLDDGVEVDETLTDPNDEDTDDDGLDDGVEIAISETDPNDADSDDDGLDDGTEVNTTTTDPNDADSDDDGLTDGAEVNEHGTDPLDADSDDDALGDGTEVNTTTTDPNDADSDDDGLDDGTEVNTTTTDPKDADSDDDGLTDGDEVSTYGTDPLDWDTDDGTVSDGEEVNNGTDPHEPSDDVAAVDTSGAIDTGDVDGEILDEGEIYYKGGCSCSSAPERAPSGAALVGLALGIALTLRRRGLGRSG